MALDLSQLSAEQQTAAIYIGYYDRAADPFGDNFWQNALANPAFGLMDLADDFATQQETLIRYPFLGDPTTEEANAFITEVFLNLFNRAPEGPDDVEEGEIDGLTFWSNALIDAINGEEGAMSVGGIILAIIEGAQDVEGGTQDRTTILNKIEIAVSWTEAADAAGLNEEDSFGNDTAAQQSAGSIIEGVTDSDDTVAAAKSTIDNFFNEEPVVPGNTIFLTSATDVVSGEVSNLLDQTKATDNDDEFLGYQQQNPFAGGVSNSLSSAERLDGEGGNDRLYAELTTEFLGLGIPAVTDIQPRLTSIEEIDLEARDSGLGAVSDFNGTGLGSFPIVVDAKNITDHEEIGSYYSDGDLIIENLTTLTESGNARNTEAVTVTMDHTDNFNSDHDASDLFVYFDNDYLLAGQDAESDIVYFLLDEDAELEGNPDRLANIDVDGIIFDVVNSDGTTTEVIVEADEANIAGTHAGFVAALQDAFQAKIDSGDVPAGSILFLDETRTTTTFPDDGIESAPIPGIVVQSGDGSELRATGFSRIEEEIGEYDVFGRFESSGQAIIDEPVTVNIDLHKAGRGGEGGDVVVGGKAQNTPDGIEDGIEVFKINVLGAGNDDPNGGMTKPSNVGTITSTGGELREVYITTDPKFAVGDTYASLTVRNGFDQNRGVETFDDSNGSSYSGGRSKRDRDTSDIESGDLELINADAFLGDLTLGDLDANKNAGRITNADLITAQGGGDVTLGLRLDGSEEGQDYQVFTAEGDDDIDIMIDGDATDYAGSGLTVSTGAGDDKVVVDTSDYKLGSGDNEDLNQAILANIEINTGSGDDYIMSAVGSYGDMNINAGSGDDFIDTSGGFVNSKGEKGGRNDVDVDGKGMGGGSAPYGSWAFNYDDARNGPSSDDQPGVPTSLAYVGGATVTVTLSGAGIDGNLLAGGGIMAEEAVNPALVSGALAGVNGFEASATVTDLENGNTYFGTQRDVNNAVIKAITSDPVLSKLISLELTENNTWVATMETGGQFHYLDLRVEISQSDRGASATAWDPVEAEARQVFSNSGIVIADLGDANGDDNGPEVPDLRTTFGTSSEDQLDSSSDWYTGLTASRDSSRINATANDDRSDTQINTGAASRTETDNVINPGEGDDLVVMSTNAGDDNNFHSSSAQTDGIVVTIGSSSGAPRQIIADEGAVSSVGDVSSFTRIDGNTLVNGASNETLVFEGMFGDDTIMNFTTADPLEEEVGELCNTADVTIVTQGQDAVEQQTQDSATVFTIALVDAPEAGEITFNGVTITVPEGATAAEIAELFEDESGNFDDGYTAVANGEEVTFTGPFGDALMPEIEDFVGSTANMEAIIVGFVTEQVGDSVVTVSAESATQEVFYVDFGDAKQDATYTFDGVEVPVLENQTGDDIAAAVLASDQFTNWEPFDGGGPDNRVWFRAIDEDGDPLTGPVDDVTDADWVGANIVGDDFFVTTYNAGLDFIDYADYLTSEFDSSAGPGPDASTSDVRIPVTLDYNEVSNLGGTGDGAADADVEANEVAVVRMENDAAEGETFSALNATVIEGLFNNNVDIDDEWGGMTEAEFAVELYTKTGTNPELIGDAKAILMVENPGNYGEYKVFELTWSGDSASDSGATVSAKLVGTQDYGTSLTGLDDINLVGSDDYAELIDNGFANIVGGSGGIWFPGDIT